ncbi:MAG TPA: carboxypeptidase-like regulatory domain-containing protein, partial [Bacteroidales bacterium]|nr:carboxypeptidase-like regulatory domain-containing protein [Bacteroidales bacterium]
MKARFILSVAFLVIFPLFVSGQALSVHGKVTDENGAPLPGAGITVLNTYSGTYSGEDGSYTLKLPARGRYSLRFSFTGYETAVYEIDLQGDETLDVQMKPATFLTDEVLVTATRAGYRTPVTYSVVTGEELKKLNLG